MICENAATPRFLPPVNRGICDRGLRSALKSEEFGVFEAKDAACCLISLPLIPLPPIPQSPYPIFPYFPYFPYSLIPFHLWKIN